MYVADGAFGGVGTPTVGGTCFSSSTSGLAASAIGKSAIGLCASGCTRITLIMPKTTRGVARIASANTAKKLFFIKESSSKVYMGAKLISRLNENSFNNNDRPISRRN